MTASALPDPVLVADRLRRDLLDPDFVAATALTVQTSLISLVIGCVAGGASALLLSERGVAWLYALAQPYLTFLNSTPRVVLVPFFVLIFGIGPASRIALSVSLVFFVMFYGVFGGIRGVRPELVRSAGIMGASRFDAWRFVVLPGALPSLFDALRISVSLALLGVVVGEIVTTPSGLGGLIRVRGEQYNLAGVFSGLVVLGALSALATGSLGAFATRVLRWR